MDIQKLILDGSKKYVPGAFPADFCGGIKDKKAGQALLQQNNLKLQEMQSKLYAEGNQGLLIVIQGLDAAGKDGTIKHVFSGVNPSGVDIVGFKQPTVEEMAHDFLWRCHNKTPRRGMIAVFNRSHYEEVLIAKVLNLPKNQNLPARVKKDIWKNRYRQIRDFERCLYESGTTIVKFHLRISKEEQKLRFLDRLEDPAKNWKFELGDLETRTHWDAYQKAYTECINETAAPHAPWVIIPGDKKWFARAAVSEVVLQTLRGMHPQYPKIDERQKLELEHGRTLLADESTN